MKVAEGGSMIAVFYKPCSSPCSDIYKDNSLPQIPVYENCIFSTEDVVLLVLEWIFECVHFRKHTNIQMSLYSDFPNQCSYK